MKKLFFVFLLACALMLCLASCTGITLAPGTTSNLQTNVDGSCMHKFSEWSIAKQPTCKEEGQLIRECEYCSKQETLSMGKSDHVEVVIPAVAATCTTDGWTEGKYCSVCYATTVERTTVKAPVHNDQNGDCECDSCGARLLSQGLAYIISGEGYCIVSGIGTCKDSVITIPSTYNGLPVKAIANSAFQHINITEVIIPDTVTTIGTYAFYGCYALEQVTIPANVTTIGSWAFGGCANLYSVTFEAPNGWHISDGTYGAPLLATDLVTTATAAQYLKELLCQYTWSRK